MNRLADWRFEHRRKDITSQFRGKIGIEFVDIGHAAAHDKNVRIKRIYDHRQSTCQTVDVSMPDQSSQAISVSHFRNNFRGRQIGSSMPGVIRLERAP